MLQMAPEIPEASFETPFLAERLLRMRARLSDLTPMKDA